MAILISNELAFAEEEGPSLSGAPVQSAPEPEPKPRPVVPVPLSELNKVKCRQIFQEEVDALGLSYKTLSPCTAKYHDASTLSLKAKASKTAVDYKRIDNKNYIFVSQASVAGDPQTKTITYDDRCEIEEVVFSGFDEGIESKEIVVDKKMCLPVVNHYKHEQFLAKNKQPKLSFFKYYQEQAKELKNPALLTHYRLYKNNCKKYFEEALSRQNITYEMGAPKGRSQ
ncbi:MAG: hypothetical protein IPM57_07605 [Oligoflexia bacterium]|nr:hypothetical protein [Oligoflexia bacterium]